MKRIKYAILGAGPSGLTIAHALIGQGIPREQVIVIEKESTVGGLCRSEEVDGAPIDIGGGHFLDLKNREVLEFLFRFMPEDEWILHKRTAKIRLRGQEIDHPLEANLWQLSKSEQVEYLESISLAGAVHGEPAPENFADWVIWKLGARIAQDYMLPYNRKIWSPNLDNLGTYWLNKLPAVSFRETLRSCLEARPLGTLPAHGQFLYPKKNGYGEVWRRMGVALGEILITDCAIEAIDLSSRTINGSWQAEIIISTIPWVLWCKFCQVEREIEMQIDELRHIAIDIDYMQESLVSSAHWIYEPDEAIAYHRLLLRTNFCSGSRGFWTETNADRAKSSAGWRHHNEFAYPVNTRGKPMAIEKILQWAASKGVFGAGRWGKWEHMNSDVAVAESLAAVRNYLRDGIWT
jgi:protoporphyrinogen oxidase